ncbi:MAG TPA: TetR/AcrR family transcriptional regulator [Acidimicrobiales bacterium]|nr:TetR/AcrR family transcriptional regulator [Acidimicrobiales bacterium]
MTVAVEQADQGYRDRIHDGFVAAVREKGLARAQIADICRHARISKRSFYECFPTKEAAFAELCAAASTATFDAVAAFAASDLPWADMVDRAVDLYLQALDDDPLMAAVISYDMAGIGDGGADARREAVDRYAGLLAAASRAASRRDPTVRELSADVALLLVGGIGELVDQAVAAGRPAAELGPVVKSVIGALSRA